MTEAAADYAVNHGVMPIYQVPYRFGDMDRAMLAVVIAADAETAREMVEKRGFVRGEIGEPQQIGMTIGSEHRGPCVIL